MTSIDAGFAVEVISDVPVVTAPEEIDVTNAARLRTALLQAAAYGTGTLVIDMSRTRFCDCAGLHAVVAAHKRAQAERGEVRLVISGPGALRVFAITGIDRVIPHFTSLDQALRMGPQIATLPAAAGELRMQPGQPRHRAWPASIVRRSATHYKPSWLRSRTERVPDAR
jgi:anti-sigma B factor antagonist